MNTKRVIRLFSLMILMGLVYAAGAPETTRAEQDMPPNPEVVRMGAWVDTIHIREIQNTADAIDQQQVGDLDMYAYGSSDSSTLDIVEGDPDLVAYRSKSLSNEIFFNVAGPIFENSGKLNPFAVPEIREALNWLVDRSYIVEDLTGGLGISNHFLIQTQFPEYARYNDTVQDLGGYYAYDPVQAEAIIAAEMINLGASKVGDQWYYNSEPVVTKALIRVEDKRLVIGDYIADQLESIGFTTERLYKTSSEARAIWMQSDPENGEWHFYTGGWAANYSIARDNGGDFRFFYSPDYYPIQPWLILEPTPEFYQAMLKLDERDYADWTERDQLFRDALEMALLDSSHLWLMDGTVFTPRRAETSVAFDLAGGLTGSDLWPYTVRFSGQEGGVMEMAEPSVLVEPWNPLGGTTWSYDSFIQRATQDAALVRDPENGLLLPQRIESADIYVESGLPVTSTLDWVDLEFLPTIVVPDDAWVDWDAENQVWITASEKYTEIQTAKVKSVITFPSDLFSTVTWHDGSPLSAADFVMAMIMRFDAAKPESAIYNENLVSDLDIFLQTFKGYRITSTIPLVIEYYTDDWQLDAEMNVYSTYNFPMWPNYGRGEGAWHNMAIAYLAEADQALAFTVDKANTLGIPWMDFISDSHLGTLKNYLNQAQALDYIPYASTMSAYLTIGDATARYASLQSWVTAQDHFWIGTGPLYLDDFDHDQNTVTLQCYSAFPDAAGRWDAYSDEGIPPSLEINYPGGAPGSSFNLRGENFPINSLATINLNYNPVGTVFTGSEGTFDFTLVTDKNTDEGYYFVTASVNPAASTLLRIDASEPLRVKIGDNPSYPVPDGIAIQNFLYLPYNQR